MLSYIACLLKLPSNLAHAYGYIGKALFDTRGWIAKCIILCIWFPLLTFLVLASPIIVYLAALVNIDLSCRWRDYIDES